MYILVQTKCITSIPNLDYSHVKQLIITSQAIFPSPLAPLVFVISTQLKLASVFALLKLLFHNPLLHVWY
jgi:hypothetical protein